MDINIELLDYQLQALQAQEKSIFIASGIGVGKTYTLCLWVLNKTVANPGIDIILAANTYSQLMGATVKALIALLESLNIKYEATLSGPRKRIEFNGSVVYLFSLEKYDNIRGIEVGAIAVDEAAYAKMEAIQVLRGRLRQKNIDNLQTLYVSSPNGFTWSYDEFVINSSPSKLLIQAKTKDNIFLPDGYYTDLLEQYGGETSPLAKQELFGEFVNLQAGAIYNQFDRGINVVACQLNSLYPVYVAIDFNVDCMNCVYIQYINGVFYQCKEVQLTHRDANTYDLGQRIIKDLQGYNMYIIPDSTGKARKTSASSGKTDHQILRDLGLMVMETSNPLVRDRQNTVNVAFLKKQLVIDPSCSQTIKEIETLSSRETEGKVSHLAVCVGYCLWKLAPLQPKVKPSHTIHM